MGLAVGFGAQSLVKDIITGFFIIYERQYDVGDYITAAGLSGIVEEIGLKDYQAEGLVRRCSCDTQRPCGQDDQQEPGGIPCAG